MTAIVNQAALLREWSNARSTSDPIQAWVLVLTRFDLEFDFLDDRQLFSVRLGELTLGFPAPGLYDASYAYAFSSTGVIAGSPFDLAAPAVLSPTGDVVALGRVIAPPPPLPDDSRDETHVDSTEGEAKLPVEPDVASDDFRSRVASHVASEAGSAPAFDVEPASEFVTPRTEAPAPSEGTLLLGMVTLLSLTGAAVVACASASFAALGFAEAMGAEAGELPTIVYGLTAFALSAQGWMFASALGSNRRLRDLPGLIFRLGSAGASSSDALQLRDSVWQRDRDGRATASLEAANLMVLLGMFGTSFWLAAESDSFSIMQASLTNGTTADMSKMVAGLLGLAPRAFVTTALAVGSAVLTTLHGGAQAAALGYLWNMDDEATFALWEAGRQNHTSGEVASLGRTLEMSLSRALSGGKLRKAEEGIQTAVDAMAAAVQEVRHAFGGIHVASQELHSVGTDIRKVVEGLKRADVLVNAVVTQMESNQLRGQEIAEATARRVGDAVESRLSGFMRAMASDTSQILSQRDSQIVRQLAVAAEVGVQSALGGGDANQNLMAARARDIREELEAVANNVEKLRDIWLNSGDAIANGLVRFGAAVREVSESGGPVMENLENSAALVTRVLANLEASTANYTALHASVRRDAELLGRMKELSLSDATRHRIPPVRG